MPIYHAYGLYIQSQIALNGLDKVSGLPDISVALGDLSHIASNALDFGDRVLGNLEDKGRFLIQHGNEIIIDPVVDLDEDYLSPAILGPAMAIILRQRGMLALHASCVAIEGRAIAFLGGSGWGKSTLAKAFHHEGYRVLTDDVMALQFNDSGFQVVPSFPQFKLSPTAVSFFKIKPNELSPLFPDAQKLACACASDFSEKSLPLHRIYVLAKGHQNEILSLSSQAAFAELVRHTRGISLLTSTNYVTTHLHQCTHLLENVPMYQFSRKPCLDDVLKSVALIEDHLEISGRDASESNIPHAQSSAIAAI